MEFTKKVYWLVFTTVFSVFIYSATQTYKNYFNPFIEINSSFFDNEEIKQLESMVKDIQTKTILRGDLAAAMVKALSNKTIAKPDAFFEEVNKKILAIGMDLVNINNLHIEHKASIGNEFEYADRIKAEFVKLLESEEHLWRVILGISKEIYAAKKATPIHKATLDEEYGKYQLVRSNCQQAVKNIVEEYDSQGIGSYLWKVLKQIFYPLLTIVLFFVLINLFFKSEEFHKLMSR